MFVVDAEPQGNELAQVFGDLAIELHGADQGEATLRAIAAAAVRIIPGVQFAGISVVRGGKVITVVPTDEVIRELDIAQTAANEGPCLSALREHRTVHMADMAADGRWPRFTAAALERGIRSSLSFQLFVAPNNNLGSLNLYARELHVFDDEATIVGDILAQHASVAMAGSAAEAQFDKALASRDIIGQAKGILMHRANVDALQAFQMLIDVSQTTNTKLLKVAELLVDEHVASLPKPQ
ncbi:GAF and ANTAR domain-containing protein [Mycobacterium sp. SMC-4]|uniref:GAF and ANTAR domain-containing protein n=1 Tax=Mycobacterium sp. SMC-4 TaxID=2857059 RepID=UPI0021B1D3A7|nr:GAF and ANTAR domain-containing protein [Mycobacterium sp. SMC-4]UXA21324.1 GAF and ANTAR domain-containing protein [Mycobacterium sp. SMC-4]